MPVSFPHQGNTVHLLCDPSHSLIGGLCFGARANKRKNANLSNILGMLPSSNTFSSQLYLFAVLFSIWKGGKKASNDGWPLMHWRLIAATTHRRSSSTRGFNKCNAVVINAHTIKARPLFWSLGSQRKTLKPLLSFRCPGKFALERCHTSAIHDKWIKL